MRKYNQILLIDDDEDDRMLFLLALERTAVSITGLTTDNCYAALKLLESTPEFSIIFLDLNMPAMHGFECLKLLKASPVYGHIPVVIYSTSGYCADIEKAQQLGAHGYLKKPSDIEVLAGKLKKFIDHITSDNPEYLYDN
jgi:CheY-like chemotaxis protein